MTTAGKPSPELAAPLVSRALEALAGRTIGVLTGAGVSTDSGIPDYRGPSTPRRTPMTFQDFVGDEAKRRRYWVGSHLGWTTFASTRPNAGHRALAALEAAGAVTGLVTQNVDGLHLQAGSREVVELHGNMRGVTCLACRTRFPRHEVAARLERDNPALTRPEGVRLGPDGDVMPESWEDVTVPDCTSCGGILKPDIVFFGEFVPATQTRAAERVVDSAGALVVAGSSLTVNSGLRLVERAHRRRVPIVVINRGATKADRRAEVKIDAGTTETLEALAAALT